MVTSPSGFDVQTSKPIHWNLSEALLYEEIIKNGEGKVSESGAIVALTGEHTGRSPLDRFIVREPSTENKVDWGDVNASINPDQFESLREDVLTFLQDKELYVQDLHVCSHPVFRRSVRVITQYAWLSLFARNLFIVPDGETADLKTKDSFTVIYAPEFEATPEIHGTRTGTFIALNLEAKLVLIGGTMYAGEMKKSIFTSLNFLLPEHDVFPMHCSANVGEEGDVSLFFGLSGTGKTTLSADPNRLLIGDDEHGWYSDGVFNFEGGCYAKAIDLKPETEPEIYRASRKFGAILENVVLDEEKRVVDFSNSSITQNTRAAYPISHLELVIPEGVGGTPNTVFLLTFDAFGVLPPIAKLSRDQAIYFFLLGYTAKVAGTEEGVKEPQATFSACFGAPFLPRPAEEYGQMLGERLDQSGANVWLLNTGIIGGPYGIGSRIPLKETRALVTAAIDGSLDRVSYEEDSVFALQIPEECPNLDSSILNPKTSWEDPEEYDRKATELKQQFESQMQRFNGS
jgi:phosphoenolpyruvate carboxykinase (ATP)